MSKTITLRLDDSVYKKFLTAAHHDNRPISNLIETLALRKLFEETFVTDFEMEEIMGNEMLLKKLKKGSREARQKKGKLIG